MMFLVFYLCMCMTCSCMHMCVNWVHMWKRKCASQRQPWMSIFTFYLVSDSLVLGLKVHSLHHCICQASGHSFQGSWSLHPTSLHGLWDHKHTCPHLCRLRPQTCVARTLSTEPSPQPKQSFFWDSLLGSLHSTSAYTMFTSCTCHPCLGLPG